jgi:hypothetical protein
MQPAETEQEEALQKQNENTCTLTSAWSKEQRLQSVHAVLSEGKPSYSRAVRLFLIELLKLGRNPFSVKRKLRLLLLLSLQDYTRLNSAAVVHEVFFL